jgi:CubicO group peptidase (beta-lactamase class C family)
MLLQKGNAKGQEVLSLTEWKEMTKLHSPRPGGGYGFGLFVSIDAKTGNVQSVSHGGALFGSFSHIAVDFQAERFGVVNYTGRRNREIGEKLQEWVSSREVDR